MKELGRILLAEDDQRDIDLTLAALEEINLMNKVDVVNNGEEALDYLFTRKSYKNRTTGNPLVVMLDLKMPKVDGMEVLEQIKENKNLKTIPVVILTSSKMEKDLLTSYNLGANAFIIKPVHFEEFIKTIKEVGAFWAILNETPEKQE
ncbi:response regulator [Mariniflexile jejuense]|uniref:Response regulator n=1 Tax=Mariniflexile jejuense TaxID=1173582 RepID=A0ABW3JFD0_9FLAO